MRLFYEVSLFVQAVLTSWAAVIGAVMTLLEYASKCLWSQRTWNKWGKKIITLTALIFIPIAIFLAWQEQYRLAEVAKLIPYDSPKTGPRPTEDYADFNYINRRGLEYAQKHVKSTRDDLPFALEVRIRSKAELQPFSITLECDGEIEDVVWWVEGFASNPFFQIKDWIIPWDSRLYRLAFQSPRLDSNRHVIVVLQSKQQINAIDIRRPPYNEPL